jgi:hypothetical protein
MIMKRQFTVAGSVFTAGKGFGKSLYNLIQEVMVWYLFRKRTENKEFICFLHFW